MHGIIKAIRKGRIAILTNDGYTIADIEYGEANIEDVVTGALDDHGNAALINTTTGDSLDVYIEAIYATASSAGMLLKAKR